MMIPDGRATSAGAVCASCGTGQTGGSYCSKCDDPVGDALRVRGSPNHPDTANFTPPPDIGSAAPDGSGPTATRPPPPSPPPTPRSSPGGRRPGWLGFAALGLALVAAVGVILALTVFSAGSDHAKSQRPQAINQYRARVAAAFGPVLDANRTMSSALAGVRGDRPVAAQQAARGAQTATATAQGALSELSVPSGAEQLATNARQALDRETSYLTAVSTALAHPAHPSAAQAQGLASNLTAALNTVEPPISGGAQSVSGAEDLATWAARTVRRQEQAANPPAQTAPTPNPPAQNAPTPNPPMQSPAAHVTSCGDGVYVGPQTSCALGANVRIAYDSTPGAATSVDAYSPVSNATYTLYCAPIGAPGSFVIRCDGMGNRGPISVWW